MMTLALVTIRMSILYTYMDKLINTCVIICVYIYIFNREEGEREREREHARTGCEQRFLFGACGLEVKVTHGSGSRTYRT